MLETSPAAEQHTLLNRISGSRFWNTVFLPPTDGVFVIDIDWTDDDNTPRIRSLVCPANLRGLDGLVELRQSIFAMAFVEPPSQNGEPRGAPLQVDAIGTAYDEEHGRDELLVRTLDGAWHACSKSVNLAKVGRAEVLLDLKKSDARDEYLARKAKRAASALKSGPAAPER